MALRNPKSEIRNPKSKRLVLFLLNWFAAYARDLPWRHTRDPYAIWVSEIMLQQTQVKTVIPYWERWMRELPTIESVANASPTKLHKLWEGLGYYTRVRNLQKAAQQIVADCRRRGDESQIKSGNNPETPHVVSCKFPGKFEAVLALPGIGRYTAGAICSIAFNQPTPILDGNVIRVLTRIFGITENPKEKKTNAQLWDLAEDLVKVAQASCLPYSNHTCSHLNQSLMELGALICTPRSPQCGICPAKKLCLAFKENRIGALPNLGQREKTTARRFAAFVIERNGKFLVRQRPAGVVNAHLWEFPNIEVNGARADAKTFLKSEFSLVASGISPLTTIKHSITRYRITLDAFRVPLGGTSSTNPHLEKAKRSETRATRLSENSVWKAPSQLRVLAFTSAHRKILLAAIKPVRS